MLPTQDLLRTEFVYRSHRRELRERVARGQDTRPGTAAKLVIARSHNGQLAPLTTAGAGLCMRMWARASRTVPRSTTPTSALDHYEARKGDRWEPQQTSTTSCRSGFLEALACEHRGTPREPEGAHAGSQRGTAHVSAGDRPQLSRQVLTRSRVRPRRNATGLVAGWPGSRGAA